MNKITIDEKEESIPRMNSGIKVFWNICKTWGNGRISRIEWRVSNGESVKEFEYWWTLRKY